MTVIRQVDPHPMKLFLNRNVYFKEFSLFSWAWSTFHLVLKWLKGDIWWTLNRKQLERKNTKWKDKLWLNIRQWMIDADFYSDNMIMAISVIVDNCIHLLSYIFYPLSTTFSNLTCCISCQSHSLMSRLTVFCVKHFLVHILVASGECVILGSFIFKKIET